MNKGNTKEIKIPKEDEKLAEFIGIILGDGNIYSYKKGKKIRVYNVRIAGDSRNDYEYLTNYVASLSKDLVGLQPRIYITRKDQIKKFYKGIGFKNPKHIKKLIDSPVV